jgi:hypothetical protein
MSERVIQLKDEAGNIEHIEGLKSIVCSKYQDLYIFDGDCFINKKTKNYIETFYDNYRYSHIASVINNKFVDSNDGLYEEYTKLIYNLDIKKYFKNMEYIGNVYVDGLDGIVKKFLEFGGVNEIE